MGLLVIGLLMVASASMVISDQRYHYPFYYLNRQIVYSCLGLLCMSVLVHIPIAFWQRCSGYILLLSILLLIFVLIPGIGKISNGSRRWFYLGGISVQASECFKIGWIIYLARYVDRYLSDIRSSLKGFIKPMVLLALSSALLLLEPDFGSTIVIALVVISMLFIAGVRLGPFCVALLGVGLFAFYVALLSPYRVERLTVFLHPWRAAFGSGYQLTQSLMAFGRGGIFGVGLGNGVQKLFYLPEAHTDFLFAVLAEEAGLLGECIVLFLFVILIGRMLWIGREAYRKKNNFSAYLCYGIALTLGIQVLVNMGVNVGLLPTKGLTLPFISYGGSSLLMNSIGVGLILRAAYENRLQATALYEYR